ncbi:MAG TPA: terminase small subunit [Sphingobium sp.]|uniref:terminase small subunit n=1 Tax=Sphingobium sp. TaxID=1912891 RepID=UPI002ED28B68
MAFTCSDKPEKVSHESTIPDRPLTAKEAAFVEEYPVDLNKTRAAIRAGFSAKTANVKGCQLYNDPRIRAAIEASIAERMERTKITADMVLDRWWQIANADPNEVVSYRHLCCRYCFGKDHAYHWRDIREHDEAVAAARKRKAGTDPANDGGFGFDATLPPHPKCPRCDGQGIERVHVADTRLLTGSAKLLYAGVKSGKDGLEVKLRDQEKALDNVARHLGMFNDKLDVNHAGTVNVTIGGNDSNL